MEVSHTEAANASQLHHGQRESGYVRDGDARHSGNRRHAKGHPADDGSETRRRSVSGRRGSDVVLWVGRPVLRVGWSGPWADLLLSGWLTD